MNMLLNDTAKQRFLIEAGANCGDRILRALTAAGTRHQRTLVTFSSPAVSIARPALAV